MKTILRGLDAAAEVGLPFRLEALLLPAIGIALGVMSMRPSEACWGLSTSRARRMRPRRCP
jgi:hypothetical protein